MNIFQGGRIFLPLHQHTPATLDDIHIPEHQQRTKIQALEHLSYHHSQ